MQLVLDTIILSLLRPTKKLCIASYRFAVMVRFEQSYYTFVVILFGDLSSLDSFVSS